MLQGLKKWSVAKIESASYPVGTGKKSCAKNIPRQALEYDGLTRESKCDTPQPQASCDSRPDLCITSLRHCMHQSVPGTCCLEVKLFPVI